MKRLLCILMLLLPTCAHGAIINIAPELRCENYDLCDEPWDYPGDDGGNNPYPGSCVYASTTTLLRAYGQEEKANYIRNNYHSGATQNDITEALTAGSIPYVCTRSGDVSFLEWASRNRLGAVIFYKQAHCVTLVDLNATHAVILDNNRIDRYEYIDRATFLRRWQREFEGFAVTPLYLPPTPWPVWVLTK